MSQRAAAARGVAAPHRSPPPPPIRPLCPDKHTAARPPSVMPPTRLNIKLPHRLPCRPHLQGHPLRPLRPRPPTTTRGRSAVSAASSGSRYLRRRCAESPTSGRWRCGSSSSTRLTFAPWRSCLGSRRRRRQACAAKHSTLEPQLVFPGLVPSRRAARMRYMSGCHVSENRYQPHGKMCVVASE